MKKLFVLLFIAANILYAQAESSSAPFSNTEIGIYGGINAVTGSETGGAALLNFHANLISNLNLELSAGYSKIFEKVDYTIKGYKIFDINGTTWYTSNDIFINQKMYNVIPLSAGFQYMLLRNAFTPYLLANVSYNLIIETKENSSGAITRSYQSGNEIPGEYTRTRNYKELTQSSGINAGFGVLYKLSSKINLDFRYLYKSASDLPYIHQFLIGITIQFYHSKS